MTDIINGVSTPSLMRKNILRLGWPAILRLFLQSIVGVVDVIMIGRLGAAAIASVDMANRLVFVLIGTLMALTVATTALVAHHIGSGDLRKANYIMWQSLYGGFIAALFLAAVGIIFAKPMLNLMMIMMEEADPVILTEGSMYLRIVFGSMVFALPMMVINAVLQGLGDMKTPLYIMLLTNVVNMGVNYLLIFGIGIFPELGVQGAAIGTSLARLAGTGAGIFVLIKGTSDIKLYRHLITWKIDWIIIRSILKIGVPAAVEQLVRQSSMIIYTALVAGFGTATLAANAVAMNINSLSFMPGFGFGTAVTTLVGQSLGAKRKDLARAYTLQTIYLTAVILTAASVAMYIWIDPIVRLYTNDLQVIGLASSALRIFVFFQPLLSIFMVIAGALRGAGDTKWVMYITIAGNWVFRLLLSLLFAFTFRLGLDGFWLAMGFDIIARTIMIGWRFRSGKWQMINVINHKRKVLAEVKQGNGSPAA